MMSEIMDVPLPRAASRPRISCDAARAGRLSAQAQAAAAIAMAKPRERKAATPLERRHADAPA